MDAIYIIGIVGTAVTIISFAYALYTNQQLARLKDYNREQAWEIYRQSSLALGQIQDLKQIEINDRKIWESISRGELAAQELLASSVQMIKRFEKKFNAEAIDRWLREGKVLNETHIRLFKSFI
jgi:hypothetical protein